MKRIYLANSREWYENPSQAQAYLDLISGSYGSGIINSEDNLLKNNLEEICDSIPIYPHYVDLGPGDGRKTLFLCNALHKRNSLREYTAVDVQPRFLDIARTIQERFRIPTHAHTCTFERFLRGPTIYKDMTLRNSLFIYLGATFGNYSTGTIDKLLSYFMRKYDVVYLSSGLRPENVAKLISRYGNSLPLFEPVIRKHKLPKGGKLKAIFNDKTSSIEQVYAVGDRVYILGVSKKHSVDSFKDQVSKYFTGKFFVEGEHIGFLGGKR